ncbi:MAG TPA: FAD-dependent oxidoreductase, partial [Chloroflexi bacterium]|nr:FAD-dependent oxidoreductase [Chloroflexota bacterium]
MFSLNISDSSAADESQLYDVLIIGAGSAGMTAAIYASRDGWKTLVLEKEATGGLAASTHLIENYPGFPKGISGPELMEKFQEQAERFGAVITEFDGVEHFEKGEDGIFRVHTTGGKTYKARAVLVATGSEPKKLGIPGEEEFANKGVSYCATCDGPLYKG